MKRNAQVERFENLTQMIRTIESRPNNKVFVGRSDSKSLDYDFTRTHSYDEALKLLENGWSEPLAEIKKGVAAGFKANGTSTKNRPQTGIVGYAPCVPNALLGLPNSMISTERVQTKVKACTILFSMSVTAGYSQEKILKAGIVILNIVNDLELAGYRVKLDVEFFCSKAGNDIASARVTVKEWRQPLDLKKLCFPISHPSMFRRLGFRWLETYPNLTNEDFRGGYGSSMFKEDYANALKTFKDCGMLDKNEYLITTYLCMNKDYDKASIMKECGLTDALGKGAVKSA